MAGKEAEPMKFVVAIIVAIAVLALVDPFWVRLTSMHAPIMVEVAIPLAAFIFALFGYSAFYEQKGGSSAGARRR